MIAAQARRTPEQVNFRHLVMDIAWFGIALATTTRFLSVYGIRLGMSEAQLAALTAMPALMMIASAMASGWWRSRFKDSLPAVLWSGFFFRLVFLLPVFTPLFPEPWQPVYLIASVTLPALAQGVAGTLFLVLMRESVDEQQYSPLQSQRFLAMNLAIAAGALGFGLWLERAPFPLNYQGMFLVAFAATLISLWYVSRVRPVRPVPVTRSQIFQRGLWEQPGLRAMIGVVMLTHIPFFAIFPLVPLRLVDHLGAAEGFIALFGLSELAGGALVALFTSQAAARFGLLPVMRVAMAGTALGAAVIALTPVLWPVLPAAFLMGASWGAVSVGVIAYMNVLAPDAYANEYAIVFTQAVGLATFVGPMLGSAVIGLGVDLVALLLMGAVLRLLGGVMLGWRLPVRRRAYAPR